MGQDHSLEDDLCASRHFKVQGLALGQSNRPLLQSAGDVDFIQVRRKHGAAHHWNHRGAADGHRGGHRLIPGLVLLIHLADVLLEREQASHRVPVMNHETVHAPVDPRTIRIFGDHRVPGADVTAPVAAVDEGHREFQKIYLVSQQDVLLARSVLDPFGL